MFSRQSHFNLRAVTRPFILSLFAALLVVACDGSKDPIGPSAQAVTGTVRNSVTSDPVTGAEVRIGALTDTTGADGRFALTDLTTGTATIHVTASGFSKFEKVVTVTSASMTHDIGLVRIELFEFGTFALYVPASVGPVRGIIVALGGPDTRGFVTGKPLGAPIPAVEASLQTLGQEFRTLASARGLAVLGTSASAMPNGPASDQLLLDAIRSASAMSGRLDLPTAPVVLYGVSGGGPEASGFTARNPERVAGLFLKVPVGVSSVTSGNALEVPTYIVLAETDAFVNNAALTMAFEGNRNARALWALAKEPGAIHHSLSPAQRQLTINWISAILGVRQPTLAGPLNAIPQTSGWLGNSATGKASPAATYVGDKALASWLPTRTAAMQWETFIAGPGK